MKKLTCMVLVLLFSILFTESNAFSRDREKEETVLIARGAVLLPKGKLIIEPSFQYTHVSKSVVSISGFTIFEFLVVGTIRVERIKREILNTTLTARYGITDRNEVEVKIPGFYRSDREILGYGTPDAMERIVDRIALGDIEVAYYWNPIIKKPWLPDVILNVRWKFRSGKDPYSIKNETISTGVVRPTSIPTGSGHYGISPGITLIKVRDPAVIYFSSNYFFNFRRDVGIDAGGNFGKIELGNSVEYSFGVSIAFSEKMSLNFSFLNRFTDSTKQKPVGALKFQKVMGSNVNLASLFIGASYGISNRSSIIASLGIGLTDDSPDFEIRFTFPFSFF